MEKRRNALKIERIGSEELSLYARVSIAYTVETVLRVDLVEGGLGGMSLTEVKAASPYLKDYDANGNGPERWPERFDLRHWGLFLAWDGEEPVGGAAVATRTPELGCSEDGGSAVLWDLRVHPHHRGRGVGKRLLQHTVDWSARQGFTQMKVETQNTNVPACRFYTRQGCRLGMMDRYGYSESEGGEDHPIADEVMLLWYMRL